MAMVSGTNVLGLNAKTKFEREPIRLGDPSSRRLKTSKAGKISKLISTSERKTRKHGDLHAAECLNAEQTSARTELSSTQQVRSRTPGFSVIDLDGSEIFERLERMELVLTGRAEVLTDKDNCRTIAQQNPPHARRSIPYHVKNDCVKILTNFFKKTTASQGLRNKCSLLAYSLSLKCYGGAIRSVTLLLVTPC